jgi:diguanylate cyclase (GGDEF)-like protein/PAS domain S-box-containing protein
MSQRTDAITVRYVSLVARAAALALTVLTGSATALADAPGRVDRVIAVFPERFPPVFNVTANGVPTGFGVELMEEVAARAGLKVEYRAVGSCSDALDALRRGEADLIPNAGVTAKRKAFVDFTRPFDTIALRLFVPRGSTATAGLDDFRDTGRVIGVVRSNLAASLLEGQPGIKLRVYGHVADGLVDLVDGRVDALAYPAVVVENLALRSGLQNQVQAVGAALDTVPRAIAVAKGHEQLRARLDTALGQVLASPEYRTIYERWHKSPPQLWTAKQMEFLLAAVLLLALAGAVYVRFRLLGRVNRELRRANAFTRAVLDASLEGILTLDHKGVVRSVNPAAEQIFGRPADEMVGADLGLIMPRKEADEFIHQLGTTTAVRGSTGDDEPFREYQALRRDGSLFPVRLGVEPAHVGADSIYVCTLQDVSRQQQAEQQASYLADHDPLTGLLNQRGSVIVLENLLAQAARYSRPLSCVNIGVDRLGNINDVHGRQAGDAILVALAERLRARLRSSDAIGRTANSLLARAGGDRFLAILPETDVDGARRAAERTLADIDQHSFAVDGERLHVTCRAGIAAFPQHGSTAQALLSHAETALHLAKQDTMEFIHAYSEEDEAREHLVEKWVDRIRTGLREDRFVLHFQPIMHVATKGIHHYETLVRYRGADGTLVMPDEFIPIAERFALIARIDTRVMELAVKQLAVLEARGADVSFSVNLSGAHIGDNSLFAWLEKLLEDNAVQAHHLIFEITETAALHNILQARSFIESVKALGCRFALDDFGVGFSSFSHLRTLPVDVVKIDGSFVHNLPESREDQALVRALTDIAHSLGKDVVAEFVATPRILDMIAEYGVDYAQGFHVGEPLPLDEYLET